MALLHIYVNGNIYNSLCNLLRKSFTNLPAAANYVLSSAKNAVCYITPVWAPCMLTCQEVIS